MDENLSYGKWMRMKFPEGLNETLILKERYRSCLWPAMASLADWWPPGEVKQPAPRTCNRFIELPSNFSFLQRKLTCLISELEGTLYSSSSRIQRSNWSFTVHNSAITLYGYNIQIQDIQKGKPTLVIPWERYFLDQNTLKFTHYPSLVFILVSSMIIRPQHECQQWPQLHLFEYLSCSERLREEEREGKREEKEK